MLSYDSPASIESQKSAAASLSSVAPLRASKTSRPTSQGKTVVEDAPQKYHHIWLVTGPAGCGKSTVAKYLAKNLEMDFIEGDEVCLTPTRPG